MSDEFSGYNNFNNKEMKNSLMRPPAMTDIYNQKMYLLYKAGHTRITSKN